MSSSPVETKGIVETFDDMAHDRCCKYKEKGLTKSSQILLDFLSSNELLGKTVLDIGCGTGYFALEMLKHGAASCVWIDLSAEAIREANQYAMQSGFQGRAKFEVANAASDHPTLSDVVTMDKVLCCYPDADGLLKTACDSSKEFLGFVVPRGQGWVKPFMRCGAAMINLVERVRKSSFRFYLHSLSSIEKQLTGNGFQLQRKTTSRVWLIYLYKRT